MSRVFNIKELKLDLSTIINYIKELFVIIYDIYNIFINL